MTFEEKTISSEMIYEGSILNVRKDKVTAVNGRTAYREIIEHTGGVTLAAITEEGKMILVKQYRKAAGKVVLESPAGRIEPGEDPQITALRELKEETGYTASHIEHVCSFYSSIGYSEEKIHLYYATGLTPGETDFDDTEAIVTEEVDIFRLQKMVLDGQIEDSKTIVAIMVAVAKAEEQRK